MAPELIDGLQNNEPPTLVKKKKLNKGNATILERLDQLTAATAESPPIDGPVDEPVGDEGTHEPSTTGRQRGSKNYSLAELKLCMEVTIPIGPAGFAKAVELYGCVAKEKGWSPRAAGALRTKWDQVSEAST